MRCGALKELEMALFEMIILSILAGLVTGGGIWILYSVVTELVRLFPEKLREAGYIR